MLFLVTAVYFPKLKLNASFPGVMFRNGEEKDSMLSLGFITKHVEDLAPLTKIIAGDKAPLLKLDREIDFKVPGM